MKSAIDRRAEVRRLLELAADPHFERVLVTVERQYSLLHNRGYVHLALCGVLLTSASIVARTSPYKVDLLVLVGILLTMVAAAVVVNGVLRLRWLTTRPGDDLEEWFVAALEQRDRKTRAYHASSWILLLSLFCYGLAVILGIGKTVLG